MNWKCKTMNIPQHKIFTIEQELKMWDEMEVIEVRIVLTSIEFKLLFLNISKVKFIQLNCFLFF